MSGIDGDTARAEEALAAGVLDSVGLDAGAELVVVAVPVSAVADAVRAALVACPTATVTDVGSVKAPIVSAVADDRFVGGHPMAGSEQDGLKGADANLFRGATWVLTPTETTDTKRYAALRTVISAIGADVVELPPERHDALVALVSHVPHLTAATLMGIAASSAEEHATLLRLAAGGFRDMTRIAAGSPRHMARYLCGEPRRDPAGSRRAAARHSPMCAPPWLTAIGRNCCAGSKSRATARINLPARIAEAEELVEVRIPVPDRTGVLAEVTTLAGELDVNIVDLEIAHSVEGDRGVLIVTIDAQASGRVCDALSARGYKPAAVPLGR